MADNYVEVDEPTFPSKVPYAIYTTLKNLDSESEYASTAVKRTSSISSIPDDSVSTTLVTRKKVKRQKFYLRMICYLVVATAFILHALVSLICISTLFAEVNKLKDSRASTSTPINELIQNQLKQQLSVFNASLSQQLAEFTSLLENQTEQIQQSLGRVGKFANNPASSCAALPPSSPSGYYWVRASNGSAVRVYCDMTRSCGNITGGWMRVAELDMANSSHKCPSGFREHNDSNICTCVRDTDQPGCSAVQYTTSHIQYSRVCGKVIAYQKGSADAFGPQQTERGIDIDSWYVDGVSITHGNPRKHIWTFAAAYDEMGTVPLSSCCCITQSAPTPPSFVGTDYFCDTGAKNGHFGFHHDDPLWDGEGCELTNTCCSFNTPPWFYRELPQPTTDDIEMRVCRDQPVADEDIQLELIEIFVR